jgi:hypothetical protein
VTNPQWIRTAAAIAVAAALGIPTMSATASSDGDAGTLTLAVYGDSPYGTTPTDTAEFEATPAFIQSVNADPDVDLVAQVGDIHSGKQFCTQAYDQSIYDLWTQYQKPVVYTPGDNEWADCHKKAEGGGTYDSSTGQITYVTDANGQPVDYAKGDPAANLDLVRSIFFTAPGRTLGQTSMPVQSQAQLLDPAHPEDQKYVENVMWVRRGIVFVTMNIPGGSNNNADPWYGAPVTDTQTQERAQRTAADLRWLDRAFTAAIGIGARAVVVVEQADMWDLDGKPASHVTNYEPFVASLAGHTTAFGGPVLLFDGDSHVYRSDNPLAQGSPCTTEAPGGGEQVCDNDEWTVHPSYDVPNFHRITVHGSTFPLEWLKLTISSNGHLPSGPNSFGPFSWQRMPQS